MRYIDADLLLEEVENNTPLNWTDSERELQEQFDYQVFRHMIEYQPTVDVAPKSEVEKIFEELEDVLRIVTIPCINAEGCITPLRANYWAIDPNDFAELKKKYTE